MAGCKTRWVLSSATRPCGVAFGNLLQGVPFGFDVYLISTYTGSFWQLLNPFALLTGVASSAMIIMPCGAYLAQRRPHGVGQRVQPSDPGDHVLGHPSS